MAALKRRPAGRPAPSVAPTKVLGARRQRSTRATAPRTQGTPSAPRTAEEVLAAFAALGELEKDAASRHEALAQLERAMVTEARIARKLDKARNRK